MKKPNLGEATDYFQYYIDLVADRNFFELFEENTNETISFFQSMAEKGNYRYADGKWTVKEVFMHIIDTERAFFYRIFLCARGDDKTVFPSMDEDFYAANVDVTNREMSDLIAEFQLLRQNYTYFLNTVPTERYSFMGQAKDYKMSLRALCFLTIGHALHHLKVVEERYI